MKHTLEDCLGFGVLEFSWVFGRTVVDLACEVVLVVFAFDQVSAPSLYSVASAFEAINSNKQESYLIKECNFTCKIKIKLEEDS